MNFRGRLAASAAAISAMGLSAGCEEELDGPPPEVSGVEPRLLCAEQIDTTVEIDGSELSPTVFDSLTEDERAILPEIALRQSLALDGSSAEGEAIAVPDSEEEGFVRWTSAEHMSFDVTPELGLEPGVYDIAITNPSGQADTLEQAIGAVPPPVIDEIEPAQMCVDQDAQSFEVRGSGFLRVDDDLPEVDVGEVTYAADSVADCSELAIPGGGVLSCETAVVTIPEGDLDPDVYDVVLRNPEPAQCAHSQEDELEITPPPELVAVDPDNAPQGETVDVTLTGEDFQEGMDVTLDADPPVEGEDVEVEEATEATATFDLEGVDSGTYSVTVANPDGCSHTLQGAFTVVSPVAFDLEGLEPPFGCNCEQTSVTILSDEGFVSTPRVEMQHSAEDEDETVELERVAFVDESTLTAVVPEDLDRPLGEYDVTVFNPPEDGGVATLEEAFRVVENEVPRIEGISPARGEPNTETDVSIFGEHFRDPVNVELIDEGGDVALEIDEIAPEDSGQIDTTFDLEGLSEDIYLVRVTNLDENTHSSFSNFHVASIGPDGNLSAFEPAAAMNTGRRMLATGDARDTLGNRHLYAVGGDTGEDGEVLRSVETAQLSAFGNLGSWDVNGYELQTPRVGASAVGVPILDPEESEFIPQKTYLYVFGGMDDQGNVLDTIERAKVLAPDEAPRISSIGASTEEGSLETGTWYYRVSALRPGDHPDNPGGETLASDEEIFTLSGEASAVELDWEAVDDADAYRVYRTPEVDGASGTQKLLAEVEDTTYTDTGDDEIEDETPLPTGSTGVWVEVEETLSEARWGHKAALVDDSDGDRFIHVLGGRTAPEGAEDPGYLASVEFTTVDRDDGGLDGFTGEGEPIGAEEETPLAFFSMAVQTPENVSGFDGVARFLIVGGVQEDADATGNQVPRLFEFSEVGEDGVNEPWEAFDFDSDGEAERVRRGGGMSVITSEMFFTMGGARDVQEDTDFSNISDTGMQVFFEEDGSLGSPVQSAAESLLAPRALGSVLFRAGFIYFIGGTSDGEDALETVERTF